MKKKVKKMIGGGELLGSVSPLAGAMTGKGILGRAMGKGMKNVSALGAMIEAGKRKNKSGKADPVSSQSQAGSGMGATPMQGMTPMKKGGAMKKSRDGIAVKGKTKGVMVMSKGGELTKRQKSTLARHSSHHTPKHMSSMKKAMKSGKTHGQAHKAAMKKVGK